MMFFFSKNQLNFFFVPKSSCFSKLVDLIVKKSVGVPHMPGFQRGMYTEQDVTPYMHAAKDHLPRMALKVKQLGFPLLHLSCDANEKINHLQASFQMNHTMKGGMIVLLFQIEGKMDNQIFQRRRTREI